MYRFIIFLLCYLVALHAHAESAPNVVQETCQKHHCMAVIDAGSTGSRVHVYAYDTDEHHFPTYINQILYRKIQPGFASIEASQDKINAYLNHLLGDVSALEHIPIYFYATAGMRLLSEEQQMMRYQRLTHWFSEHNDLNLVDYKTITGSEEGVYGWLAINYQLGAFTQNQPSTVGFMDMGGASVQVVFPAQNAENISDSDLVKVDINDKHFSLFAHSFLSLGQTEVIKQFLTKEECFSNDYTMINGATGQGDAYACQVYISTLINNEAGVDQLVQPILQANPVTTWYTMGGLNMLATTTLFDFSPLKITSESLIKQSDAAICRQSWNTVHQADPDNERTYAYCLISSYYYALLVNGYGINPNEPIYFMPESQNSDWSLGVILQYA